MASSSDGLAEEEPTGAGVCFDACTLVDGLTVGVSTEEAVTAGFAVGVVLLFFATAAMTPAPSMMTINVASTLWKPFSAVSPLGTTSV